MTDKTLDVSIDSEVGKGSYYSPETQKLDREINCPIENLVYIFVPKNLTPILWGENLLH